MILYLASIFQIYNKRLTEECQKQPFKPDFFYKVNNGKKIAILESFYKVSPILSQYLPYIDLILDSGAFTVINDTKGKTYNTDWDEYIEKYAKFIVENNINLFFELDIDFLIGYDKVLEYRKKLEKLTDRPCIPVFHKRLGLAEFKKMCQDYEYIGLSINNYQYKTTDLVKMISLAHSYKTKIHGLGYTKVQTLPLLPFDSVDSTSLIIGSAYGKMYRFNNSTLKQYNKQKGLLIKNRDALLDFNFKEWVKYQNYLKQI